ncbi:hypothetical protein F5Y17DRAFT_478223 [Xylariaceae sp. FL0594]|nr:hypothetical protein F5Y17DRAFT_478223 [Xylariaceae sp. FL0594]
MRAIDLVKQNIPFQMAPEGGTFATTNHSYTIVYRDVTPPEEREDPRDPSAFVPSKPGPVEIVLPADRLSAETQSSSGDAVAMLEVCSGGCNEPREPDPFSESCWDMDAAAVSYFYSAFYKKPLAPDEAAIESILRARLHSIYGGPDEVIYDRMHIEWVSGDYGWDTPVPAYFSLGHGHIVPHSGQVTKGHLALMKTRGNVDCIWLDYRRPAFEPHTEEEWAKCHPRLSLFAERRSGLLDYDDFRYGSFETNLEAHTAPMPVSEPESESELEPEPEPEPETEPEGLRPRPRQRQIPTTTLTPDEMQSLHAAVATPVSSLPGPRPSPSERPEAMIMNPPEHRKSAAIQDDVCRNTSERPEGQAMSPPELRKSAAVDDDRTPNEN